ncbi:hypothetical protein MTR_4g031670 [Medicago truncatula]|uniref:Uncharacterized protein n=1 Tax=Medicago truncatula TaxID=3880 RepID=G7JM13_MEDTR|nr:hypothetical protein MTR_4g031670 [Medicago truncatula]
MDQSSISGNLNVHLTKSLSKCLVEINTNIFPLNLKTIRIGDGQSTHFAGYTDILMEVVNITSISRKTTEAYCKNAHGKASSTSPYVPCLS